MCDKKKVRINPIPDFLAVANRSNTVSVPSEGLDVSHSVVCRNDSSKCFNIFFPNTSSLSPHAQAYLFALPMNISAIAITEHHKSVDYVVNTFSQASFSAVASIHKLLKGAEQVITVVRR